jgi:hypothetical protein
VKEQGTLADFVIGKTVLALAVVGLLGAALSLGSSSRAYNRHEELTLVAQSIAGALEDANRIPGKVELVRALPRISRDFDVAVSGTLSAGVQTLVVNVTGGGKVERSLVVGYRVNGGDFVLSASNPRSVRMVKDQGWSEGFQDHRGFLPFLPLLWGRMRNPEQLFPQLSLELM